MMSTSLALEYAAVTNRQEILERSGIHLSDEGDNHVIELAVATGTALLATHINRDFRRAELHFPWLRILSPDILLTEYP
jgi:hypothetical protein